MKIVLPQLRRGAQPAGSPVQAEEPTREARIKPLPTTLDEIQKMPGYPQAEADIQAGNYDPLEVTGYPNPHYLPGGQPTFLGLQQVINRMGERWGIVYLTLERERRARAAAEQARLEAERNGRKE